MFYSYLFCLLVLATTSQVRATQIVIAGNTFPAPTTLETVPTTTAFHPLTASATLKTVPTVTYYHEPQANIGCTIQGTFYYQDLSGCSNSVI
jgi:hypothetical protein